MLIVYLIRSNYGYKDKLVSLNGLKAAVDKIKNLLLGKQDKLTAGTGISISNNTISSTDYSTLYIYVNMNVDDGNCSLTTDSQNLLFRDIKNAFVAGRNVVLWVRDNYGYEYFCNLEQIAYNFATFMDHTSLGNVYPNIKSFYIYPDASGKLAYVSYTSEYLARTSDLSSKQNTITKNTQLEVNSIDVESNIYFKGKSAAIGTNVEKIVIGGESQNQTIFIGSDASVDVGNSTQFISGRNVTIGQYADYLKIGEGAFNVQIGNNAMNVEIGKGASSVFIDSDWEFGIFNTILAYEPSSFNALYLGNGNTSVYINNKSIEEWCSGSSVTIGTTENYTYPWIVPYMQHLLWEQRWQ